MEFTKRSSVSLNSSKTKYDEGLRTFFLNVYKYMFMALLLTGVVAYGVASSPTLLNAIFGTPLSWVVMLAPLGMVFYISSRIMNMSVAGAQLSFWIFAGLMGMSLATIFIAYTTASIAKVFFITSSTFGVMSLYGYTTKKDLTSMGSFLIMGLFGIIIASLVNLFLKSPAIDFVVSLLGVGIFTGLIAYDTQKLKRMYYQLAGAGEMISKVAIFGALNLYLDFINLFLMLLRLMGDRR